MNHHRWTWIPLLVGSWLIVALGGCKNRSEPSQAPEGTKGRASIAVKGKKRTAATKGTPHPVEVVLWHSYREKEKLALEEVARKFNASHKDIRLTLMNIPYDAFVDKVSIATPRGQGPDLFIFAHNMIGVWVDNYHVLEPITTKVSREVLRRFMRTTVRPLVYKGSLYGLPLAFKCLVLFYNPDLVESPPDTLDELLAMARKAKKKGVEGLVYEASLLYFNAPFIHGFGGRVMDERGNILVDSEGTVKALEFVRKLVREGLVPRGVNSAMVGSLFGAGKAAMAINGQWFRGELGDKVHYKVALLPAVSSGERLKPYLGSEAVFMSAYSKHKDAALKVMLYITSDEAALVRLRLGGQTVANVRVYGRKDVASDPVISVFKAQADNSVLMPSRPEMQAVWSAMDMAINRSVFGNVPIRTALREAKEKIQKDISRMKK